MPRPSVREQLVSSGLETLHAQGFNGCSIQDITDAAGVPKGSFFNHFRSKEALALEALGRYGEGSRIDMLFDKNSPPIERLRQHFNFLADTYEKWGFERGCLLGNLGSEMATSHPDMREALRQMFEAWSGAVGSVLREAQAAGDISSHHDPDQLGRFLVNAWEGVAMRLKIVRNRTPVIEFFNICFRLLLK
jgi:TetR/AcrR family transcriptional regulator, transcriptional repressor for nem operon